MLGERVGRVGEREAVVPVASPAMLCLWGRWRVNGEEGQLAVAGLSGPRPWLAAGGRAESVGPGLGPARPVGIPAQIDHLFRRKSITRCDANRFSDGRYRDGSGGWSSYNEHPRRTGRGVCLVTDHPDFDAADHCRAWLADHDIEVIHDEADGQLKLRE